MTRYHDPDPGFDPRLADWLEGEPDRAPGQILELVVAAVPSIPQHRALRRSWRLALPTRLAYLAALIVVAMGTGIAASQLLGSDQVGVMPTASPSIQPEPAAARMTLVARVVDAINRRDLGSLRSSFTADGILEFPAVDGHSGREGNVDMSEWSLDVENFPENWLGTLGTWGLEARLGSCRTLSESAISCAVRTGWHVLQVEIGEEWTFDFAGARVRRLVMARVDPEPPNPSLPLGLDDLERWATWLRKADPRQADRLLPTGPDLFGHFYFRFGLDASPDEIGASIDEYLQSRDSLVGTYVCSEEETPGVTHLWDVREDGTITRRSGQTGEALPAGTWSRDGGRLLTTFEGGATSFESRGLRLVVPGGWACTRT